MIVEQIKISAKPEDVFAYIEQLDRHGEWQEAVLSAHKEPEGPTRIGTRNTEKRQMPGGPREVTSEIYEYDPPQRIATKSVGGGPITATVTISIEPADEGSRLTFTLDLQGHGVGKVFVIFARKSASGQVPKDLASLKQKIESGEAAEPAES